MFMRNKILHSKLLWKKSFMKKKNVIILDLHLYKTYIVSNIPRTKKNNSSSKGKGKKRTQHGSLKKTLETGQAPKLISLPRSQTR